MFQDRLDGRVAMGETPGRKPALDRLLECKLIDPASNRAQMGMGFGKSQFMRYTGELATNHKVSFKRQVPSTVCPATNDQKNRN